MASSDKTSEATELCGSVASMLPARQPPEQSPASAALSLPRHAESTQFLLTSAKLREINNAPEAAGHVYNDHFAVMAAPNDRRGTTRGGTNYDLCSSSRPNCWRGAMGGGEGRGRGQTIDHLGALVTCVALDYCCEST